MYTSDKTLKKHLLFNVIGTAFLALFAGIYEAFSHGVYSYFMLFAFAAPLMMGVLPYTILLLIEKYPNRMFLNLWNSAIATLSVGSVFAGVLEIYGTTNALIVVYPVAGGILILLSLGSLLIGKRQKSQNKLIQRYDTASLISRSTIRRQYESTGYHQPEGGKNNRISSGGLPAKSIETAQL